MDMILLFVRRTSLISFPCCRRQESLKISVKYKYQNIFFLPGPGGAGPYGPGGAGPGGVGPYGPGGVGPGGVGPGGAGRYGPGGVGPGGAGVGPGGAPGAPGSGTRRPGAQEE
ncbi:hypothetical protein AVEN_171139-1 [Araneus ventricosus]|uniref:Uncharacterized protein n=1 Tax=Araneus ventricosus TaxID=182803 RepID=A0A4Y2DGS6_ARAVE|nr:hypothetical protein AVEN_171139-1 [Araneus ventricosus]